MTTQDKTPGVATNSDRGSDEGTHICSNGNTKTPVGQAPGKLSEGEQRRLIGRLLAPSPEDPGPDLASLDPGQFSQGERRGFVYTIKHGGVDPQALSLVFLSPGELAAIWKSDPGYTPPAQEITTWQHDALVKAKFRPQTWLVDGLVIADGLTWLGAKKKLGKSLLCLQIAVAVASGGYVLGRKCTQGTVILIALEDGAARLQLRLAKQQASEGLPITYKTRFRPLDNGGLEDLRDLLQSERPQFVIIDTLAAAKTGKTDENSAGEMGDISNALRILAQDYHCGILVVAHHGKVTSGDPGFDIRGSSAQPGASEVNLAIYRGEDGCQLKGEGRDIDNLELRIALDIPTLSWSLIGDARKLAKAENDEEVCATLRKLNSADAGTLAREIGRSRSRVQRLLKRLEREGLVTCSVEKTRGGNKLVYKVVI